jgi:hypothetical protein
VTELLLRLLDVAALLLSFGLLLAGRAWPMLYAAQLVVVALFAVVTAGVTAHWAALADVPILLVQAVAIPRLLRGDTSSSAAAPLLVLGLGVGLTVLSAAVPFADGFTVPLAMVLLGLLAAAGGQPMRFGVLLLLNGVAASLCLLPAEPLDPVLVLALAVVASIAACDGVPRWNALR